MVGGQQVRAELEGVGEAGNRGFGRLSREMEAANARLAGFSRAAKLAVAAAAGAFLAGAGAMIRSSLELVDSQAKMAQSLRTTVESVQVLTWAGELAGVSMGEIEQATKKLTTRLSEAAGGSGSAVKALARLNLTAAELQRLPLDQRIVAIQQALGAFVPEAQRAAVASDLFGDRAALAFLRIDTATLEEAARDVRDFGVAVSDGDARQIERTGDAIARLGLIWRGLCRTSSPSRPLRRWRPWRTPWRRWRAPPGRSASRSAGSSTTSAGSRAMPPPSPASWPGAGSPGWWSPPSRCAGLPRRSSCCAAR